MTGLKWFDTRCQEQVRCGKPCGDLLACSERSGRFEAVLREIDEHSEYDVSAIREMVQTVLEAEKESA